MASITLFHTPHLASIGALTLDASVHESHSKRVEITDHQVESGADVNDHARTKPDMVTIEGIVSDTPISRDRTIQIDAEYGTGGGDGTVDSDEDDGTVTESSGFGRPGVSAAAFERLMNYADTHELLTVVTARRVYTSMLVESVEVPGEVTIGDAFRFTCTLKKYVQVATKVTSNVRARNVRAHGKKKYGKQHLAALQAVADAIDAGARQARNQQAKRAGLSDGDLGSGAGSL